MNNPKALPRFVVSLAGYFGLINFLRGVFFVLWAALVVDSLRASIGFLVPYLVITLLFAGVCVLAHYRRLRSATIILVIAVLASLAMYRYDVTHGRYQIHGIGQCHLYFLVVAPGLARRASRNAECRSPSMR